MLKHIGYAISLLAAVCLLLAPPAIAEEESGTSASDSGPIADPYVPEIPDLPVIETPDYGSVPEFPKITSPDYGSVPEFPEITSPDYGSVAEPPPIEQPDYSGSSSGAEIYPDAGGTSDSGANSSEGTAGYEGTEGTSGSTDSGVTFYEPGSVSAPPEVQPIDPAPYNPDVGSVDEGYGNSEGGGVEEEGEACWTVDGIGMCQ